jgi:CRP-like cAMP-binding protein
MFGSYDMHTLLLIVVSFFCGVAIILSYKAFRFFRNKDSNNFLKTAIVDNRIKQYAQKLHMYDKAIADLRLKVDTLEMYTKSHSISRDVQSKNQYLQRDIDMISQNAVIIDEVSREKTREARTLVDTLEQILLLLKEKPMTTRQIQETVRKTREHTSRIMNGLYQSGFVTRDASSKPFRYSITDTGLRHLHDLHSDSNITTRKEQSLESV